MGRLVMSCLIGSAMGMSPEAKESTPQRNGLSAVCTQAIIL